MSKNSGFEKRGPQQDKGGHARPGAVQLRAALARKRSRNTRRQTTRRSARTGSVTAKPWCHRCWRARRSASHRRWFRRVHPSAVVSSTSPGIGRPRAGIGDRAADVSCPDAKLGALSEKVRWLAGHGAERVHELDAPPGYGVTRALKDCRQEDGDSPLLGDRSLDQLPHLVGRAPRARRETRPGCPGRERRTRAPVRATASLHPGRDRGARRRTPPRTARPAARGRGGIPHVRRSDLVFRRDSLDGRSVVEHLRVPAAIAKGERLVPAAAPTLTDAPSRMRARTRVNASLFESIRTSAPARRAEPRCMDRTRAWPCASRSSAPLDAPGRCVLQARRVARPCPVGVSQPGRRAGRRAERRTGPRVEHR